MINFFLDKIFSNETHQVLEKGLDVASLRHQVITHNLANVNTPGYKIKKVSFEASLQRSLKKYGVKGDLTHDGHMPLGRVDIPRVKPWVKTMTETSFRNDKNNVDVDVEMAKLSKNNLIYQTIMESFDREIGKLRLTITRSGRV